MGTISVKFSEKDEKIVRAAAAEAGKTASRYCRDLIMGDTELASMSASKVKDYIDEIQKQVDTLQAYHIEMMKRIYPLCTMSSTMTKQMLLAVYAKHPEMKNKITKDTNDYVAKRYKEIFGEDYVNPDDK